MKAILLTTIGLFAHLLSVGQVSVGSNAPPSDADISRFLIGTWTADANHRHSSCTYLTNGTCISSNWLTGTNRTLNMVLYAESTWEVRDGVETTAVTKTSDPLLCPLGRVWQNRFILLSQTGAVAVTQFGLTNILNVTNRTR